MLFHICCGVCGFYPVKLLKKEFSNLTLYFFNPNIHPKKEYLKRLKYAKELSKIYNLPFIEGEYKINEWFDAINGLENEPESGKRCEICFKYRLEEVAKKTKKLGFRIFGTTLTISPYKDADIINKIGKELACKYKLKFYKANFKKQHGFKKSIELAKKYNFYRQNYCGCIFSKRA